MHVAVGKRKYKKETQMYQMAELPREEDDKTWTCTKAGSKLGDEKYITDSNRWKEKLRQTKAEMAIPG